MSLLAPVDTEGAVRAWLRTESHISAVVGNRVWFGVPIGAVYPLITLSLVGDAPLLQDGGGWINAPLIQFDCLGSGPSAKAEAAAVALAVQKAAYGLQDGTVMATGAVGMWAHVESVVWAPDPESGRAWYVVDVEFGIRAA